VLELKVPHVEPEGLSEALLESWPSYATYVVSFLTIGIIWINHHAVMDRIKSVNRTLLFLNLVFLMAVAVIPFPTALLGDYLQAGYDERLAAAVYGTTMALMGIVFGLIWAYAVLGDDLLIYQPGYRARALVGSTWEEARNSGVDYLHEIEQIIDYQAVLQPGDRCRVGDTVLFGFRTQMQMTRSYIAPVSGISSGEAKLHYLFDHANTALDERYDPVEPATVRADIDRLLSGYATRMPVQTPRVFGR